MYRQNAFLTHKYNRTKGRHGWFRLTPAYSVKLVEDLLSNRPKRCRVLDPFSGTATTPLCAAMLGHDAVSVDINSFLEWLGNVKLSSYTKAQIASVRKLDKLIGKNVRAERGALADVPPLHNIERWWSQPTLLALRRIKAAVNKRNIDPGVRNLAAIAFCKTIIATSNASFGHQSMSFKSDKDSVAATLDVAGSFSEAIATVVDSVLPNPSGAGRVLCGDARNLTMLNGEKLSDLVITSPPYVNRMSYIRELRPYMYWTDFLTVARQAGELDWDSIGGTWGIATSRLNEWQRDKGIDLPTLLESSVSAIAASGEKNSELMASYVARYFEDIAKHLLAVYRRVRSKGEIHYIVGNSKFYSELVQTQEIYGELMLRAGFKDVEIRIIRKRNSKKELFEYDVSAHKGSE